MTDVWCWWVHSACKEPCSGQHSCYHSTAWLPPHNSPVSSISHILTPAASELLPKCRTKLLLAKDLSIAIEQQTLLCHTSCCVLRLGSLLKLCRKLWAGWKPVAVSDTFIPSTPCPIHPFYCSCQHTGSVICGCASNSSTASMTVKGTGKCLWMFAGFPLASTAMKPTMFRWPLWQNYWIFNNHDKIESRQILYCGERISI